MRGLLAFLLCPLCLCGGSRIEEYVLDVAPSAHAKANFLAARTNGAGRVVSRTDPRDEQSAYFTEDGAISLPPGAMVQFQNSGQCMDPSLPAPKAGEPMQFVNVEKLIPRKLRETYDALIDRYGKKDPKVQANNMQHLVWALRTAGTEHPMAEHLGESQRQLLDECAGGHERFSRYHEREKRRNRKHAKRDKRSRERQKVTVGSYSYDPDELVGTNGAYHVERHVSSLIEMGTVTKQTPSIDFRYGEIEDELYTDVVGTGGLSYQARILNASDRRREVRLTEFAAQVGMGAAGTRRQRVTMIVPEQIMVILGAAAEERITARDLTVAETEVTRHRSVRARTAHRHSERNVEGRIPGTEETIEVPIVSQKTETTIVKEPDLQLRLISLSYDAGLGTGVLTAKIESGTLKQTNKYVRTQLREMIEKAPKEVVDKIPADKELNVETVSLNAHDECEIYFRVEGR